jgi:hypothetical protein
MQKNTASQSAFFNLGALIGLFVCFAGVLVALFAFGAPTAPFQRETAMQGPNKPQSDVVKMMGPLSQDLDLMAFAPASGNWTVTGGLNTARAVHTGTLLSNGMVLVAGGFDSSFNASASAELYDPTSGSWTATGSLNTARAVQTATLLVSRIHI